MKTKFSHGLFPRCTMSSFQGALPQPWHRRRRDVCSAHNPLAQRRHMASVSWGGASFLSSLGFDHHIWNLFNLDQKNIRKYEHSTIKLQINHFCSFSRQTTALRSALISGGAGGNRNPRGTIFIFHSDTLTKLRQELVEFMESQGYRWIGTAGF